MREGISYHIQDLYSEGVVASKKIMQQIFKHKPQVI